VTGALGVSVLAGLVIVLSPATRAAEADCLGTVRPQYAALNSAPNIGFIPVSSGHPSVPGANCFDDPGAPAAWLTVAAVVTSADSAAVLMQRFGAISQLLPVQYWSTTEHKWRPMVSAAAAVVSPDSRLARADFSLAELLAPADRYYSLTDTRSGHAVVYRLRVRSPRASPEDPWATELTVDIANVDPIKQWGITLYAPGGLHTLYLLQQRAGGTWSYYSITRLLPSSFLAAGHDKSYINRAVALYRHVVGIPTNTEPPAAR
jgi:hypothetical protein